jgi:hypothetical protein
MRERRWLVLPVLTPSLTLEVWRTRTRVTGRRAARPATRSDGAWRLSSRQRGYSWVSFAAVSLVFTSSGGASQRNDARFRPSNLHSTAADLTTFLGLTGLAFAAAAEAPDAAATTVAGLAVVLTPSDAAAPEAPLGRLHMRQRRLDHHPRTVDAGTRVIDGQLVDRRLGHLLRRHVSQLAAHRLFTRVGVLVDCRAPREHHGGGRYACDR